MNYFSTLIFGICILSIVSCSIINHDENPLNEDISIDTTSIVFQDFHDQLLIANFDTQTVYIEKTFEEFKIYGEWDTIIASNEMEQKIVEIISPFENITCSNFELRSQSDIFGQTYMTQCWHEHNGFPSLDSGVRKIISTKYGVIFNRGYFTNSGQVISAIDGIKLSEEIKNELIKNY